MKKITLNIIAMTLLLGSLSLNAAERSPFTKVDFGLFLGWGNFIKVENYDLFDENKTHFVTEINGKDYKSIISEAKGLYGDNWKCRFSEHFVETMSELGVVIGETVDLKLYLFSAGHEVIEVRDVPVTEENLEEIQFESDFCS